ncbi:MAG: Gfo/Idh/MocA family oxidoreductase [Candidatus Latescibacteria bacterium]|nr:Gfo/Idh/MocA family oxidoreductase [Candidatus Latescibacterota bacterium]
MHRWIVGIIGCGWIAPFHAKALRQLRERAIVAWVADPDVGRAERLAADLQGLSPGATAGIAPSTIRLLSDYRVGLSDVEAVFILVPHHLHYSITRDALRAGCHVLLEKPFALTLPEAHDMIAAADHAGRAGMGESHHDR